MKKNKLTLIITFIVMIFPSCERYSTPKKQPFVIIYKTRNDHYDNYKYVDKDGTVSDWFEDDKNKYNVGDTL